ncbi:ATP synthase F1 subunit gamma [Lentisphaera profundi]|uniref:ATP synthase gamma chain n=1 Tax=Lentisphaera profundi TaxID=1658616 RepID=A0ABY7VYL9_9BACT|nr:ATP synthase F1 subunit gamma [Lentisphaera profundi]WDE97886.1 ATP synthase F1 subunit gamma [Lentisphaera profundi]
MPSQKEYNVKIASLGNTAKVTKTMNMVSTSKYRKAQDAQGSSRLYSDQLNQVIAGLVASGGELSHPLMKTPEVKKVLVIAFTSDKGLCAGFNNNLVKFVNNFRRESADKYETIDFITCGKRGYNAIRKDSTVIANYDDKTGSPEFDTAREIGDKVQKLFIDGEYDQVLIANNNFVSALSQIPIISTLLPVTGEVPTEAVATENATDYIYEPGQAELLSYLLPKTVNFQVFKAFLENAAGEHAARMAAMDAASSNARDLIQKYTVLRNRARQAAITTELTEIVAGAESLK